MPSLTPGNGREPGKQTFLTREPNQLKAEIGICPLLFLCGVCTPKGLNSRVVGLSGLREFGVLLREVGGKWGEQCHLNVKALFLYKFFLGVKLWS